MVEKIVSPVCGIVVPLDQVPDAMLAYKLIGDGIAVVPECEE